MAARAKKVRAERSGGLSFGAGLRMLSGIVESLRIQSGFCVGHRERRFFVKQGQSGVR